MGTETTTSQRERPDARAASRRLLAVSLGLAMLPAAVFALTTTNSPPAADHATFNPSDYELAWQAFLGAGKLKDAIALAEKALSLDADSVLWHRRLASAAEQDGNTPLAAAQNAWLVIQGGQADLLAHAIELSNATQQNDLAIRLMLSRADSEPFNPDHWEQMLASMLDVGHFDQALAALANADQRQPRIYFLQQQANVLGQAGRADARMTMLQRIIARYGADPTTSVQLATAQYLHGELDRAMATLRRAIPRATPQDTLYWQTTGSLAWILQDFATAQRASEALVAGGQGQPADYGRLYRLHAAKNPAIAYAWAVSGWRHTHDAPLFFEALAAATQLQRPALLDALFAELDRADRKMLERESQYWVQWALQAHRRGDDRAAMTRYRQAMRLAPDDPGVYAGYLWLLVDRHDSDTLRVITDRLGAVTPADDDIREALTAALALLDQPSRALALMRGQQAPHREDPQWLTSYADLLDQADHAELAQAIRRAAVAPSRRALEQARPEAVARRRENMLALTSHLAPGDPTTRAIAPLLRAPSSDVAREQVLAWTIALNSPDATSLWLQRAYGDRAAPAWALLGQSLANDDDSTTMHLLLTQADRLPRRDRVTAAEKLGWRGYAATLAYEGLQREPDDRQLTMQFQPLAIAQSDTVGSSLAAVRSGGLRAIDSGLDWRRWLNQTLSLKVEAHRIQQAGYDSRLLQGIPGYGQYATVTLTEQLPRGERGVSAGSGSNLSGYAQIGAFYRYRLWQSLELGAAIDYGARADESIPLAIAGLSDRLRTTATYQWTTWDSLTGTGTLAHLRAQGGGSLGARQSIDLEYRHKLWLAPPDFTLIASATDARFQRATELPAQLIRLLPVGQPADASFFVPRSYAQACVGAAFNENFRTDWSDQLRPFGNASVCQNSVSGGGAAVTLGLAAPVLGPDHFSAALIYSSNTGPTGSRDLNLQLNYRYYFTP